MNGRGVSTTVCVKVGFRKQEVDDAQVSSRMCVQSLELFDEKDYYAVVEIDMPSKAGPKFQTLGRF